jgi:hypothetical protein
MPRAVTRRFLAGLLFTGTAAVLAGSCVDALRPRVHPADPGATQVLQLVAIKDTVRVVGDWALFYLETEQTLTSYDVYWTASNPTLLASQGNGSFRLQALPAGVTLVKVTVQYSALRDSAYVVIVP